MGTVIVKELEIVADTSEEDTSGGSAAAQPEDLPPVTAPIRPTDVEAIERFYLERAMRVFAH